MRRKHSAVTAIANHLVSCGYSRTNAFVKAWVLVKLDKISTKAVGVTFGNRQRALEHLARYSPERVTLHLVRDKRNTHDKNAVAVVADVSRKGAFCMGYLARSLSAFIAPLLEHWKGCEGHLQGREGLVCAIYELWFGYRYKGNPMIEYRINRGKITLV